LWRHWFKKGKAEMEEPLTTEKLIESGKRAGFAYLAALPPEEFFSHYKLEEVFRYYKPQEIWRYYTPEELLSYYKPEELLSCFSVALMVNQRAGLALAGSEVLDSQA